MTEKLISLHRKKLLLRGNLHTAEKFNITHEVVRVKKEIEKVDAQIKELSDKSVVISDHAIVRYLERICGIDLAEFKKKILPKKYEQIADTLGRCEIPIEGGGTAIITDRTVVTVTK